MYAEGRHYRLLTVGLGLGTSSPTGISRLPVRPTFVSDRLDTLIYVKNT